MENHAAVWVPDSEANICMHCKKTQFTMLIRRVTLSSENAMLPLNKISYIISILASLSKLRCCGLWAMFFEEIPSTRTEQQTVARLFGLLR